MSDVGGFIIGAVSTAAGAAAIALPIPGGEYIGSALIRFGINQMASSIKGRPSQEGMQNNVGSPKATLPVVYGTAKIGIKLALSRVDDASTDRKDYYRGGPICIASEDGSGINGVNKVWLDDTLAIDGPATGELEQSTGVQSFFGSNLRYGLQLGTDSETVDNQLNNLFASAWPTTSKPLHVAVLHLKLVKDKEIYPRIPNVQVEVEGNKVYDPRDGTWKFSSNPALCLLDYLTADAYGAQLNYPERDADGTTSEIDEASFKDAANYADELVQDGAGGTQKRFEFNGWLDTGNTLEQNIAVLANAMRGELVQQGGVFRLVIRRDKASTTYELLQQEDGGNVKGELEVTRKGAADVPNKVVVHYVDENEAATEAQIRWPEPGDANTFLENDGDVPQQREISVQGVQNAIRAQQIGMVALKEARDDAVVELTADESALQLEVGDVVPLTSETHGWDSKSFWVMGMTLMPNWEVRLALREFSSSSYTLDPQNQPDAPPGSNLPDPSSIAAPGTPALVSDATTQVVTGGGDKVPGIQATWTPPSDPYLDHVVVLERKSGSSTWRTVGPVDSKDDQEVNFRPEGGEEGETWEVGVYAVNTRGVQSSISTNTVTLSTDWTAQDSNAGIVSEESEDVDTDADGDLDTGRLTLTVIAPRGTFDVEFYERAGRDDSFPSTPDATATGLSSGQTATQDIPLPDSPKTNAYIKYIVLDAGTTNQVDAGIVPFDSNESADVNFLDGFLKADDTVRVAAGGDDDTGSLEVQFGAPLNETKTISGRSGSVTSTGTLSAGEEVTITVTAESPGGVSGGSESIIVSKDAGTGPTPIIDRFGIESETAGTGTDCSPTGGDTPRSWTLEWEITNFDSAIHTIEFEVWGDYNDNGYYTRKIDTGQTTNQTTDALTADGDAETVEIDHVIDSTNCTATGLKGVLKVFDSNNNVVARAETRERREAWYSCLDGSCANAVTGAE